MENPDAQETQAETAAPEAAPEAPAPEGAPETPAQEGAPETPAQEGAPETPAQEAMPEQWLPEEPPAPKARAKGRPKGSKTVNRRPKATANPEGAEFAGAEFASAPSAVIETPPDIFEIIRQRQTAQFERRQAFYQSFLPVR